MQDYRPDVYLLAIRSYIQSKSANSLLLYGYSVYVYNCHTVATVVSKIKLTFHNYDTNRNYVWYVFMTEHLRSVIFTYYGSTMLAITVWYVV